MADPRRGRSPPVTGLACVTQMSQGQVAPIGQRLQQLVSPVCRYLYERWSKIDSDASVVVFDDTPVAHQPPSGFNQFVAHVHEMCIYAQRAYTHTCVYICMRARPLKRRDAFLGCAGVAATARARVEERMAALSDTLAQALAGAFSLLSRLSEVESMVRVLQLVSVLVEVSHPAGRGGSGTGNKNNCALLASQLSLNHQRATLPGTYIFLLSLHHPTSVIRSRHHDAKN